MNDDVSDLDIYRSAMVFVNKYGDDAKTEAALKALQHSNKLKVEGLSIWCRIVDAIENIQNTQTEQSPH